MRKSTIISIATGCLIIGALIGTYTAPECKNTNHDKILENNKLYITEMDNMSKDINKLVKDLNPYIKEKENQERHQQRVQELINQVEFLMENDPWFKANTKR